MFYVKLNNEFRGRFISIINAMNYACLLKSINPEIEKNLSIVFE